MYSPKDLLKQQKSCRFIGESLVLEAKFGKAWFNTSVPNKGLVVYLRRISGTGKITINGNDFIVGSKTSCAYEIEGYKEEVEILRPVDGLGEIAVLGIKLHTEELEETVSKWKATLRKCGEYRSLRLEGDKLYAATGGFIAAKFVEDIATVPEGAYVIEDDKIRFAIPCEIVKIVPSDTTQNHSSSNINIFPVRQAPTPLLTPEPLETVTHRPQNSFPVLRKDRPNPMSNPILYDSVIVNEFNPSKFPAGRQVGAIRSNNINYLILKKDGSYSISTSFIRPHVEYIVVLNAKKLNGNGKVQISLSGGGTSSANISGDMIENYISINSGVSVGQDCMLTISMPSNGVGEILVSRLLVIEGIQLPIFRAHGISAANVSYGIARSLSGLSVYYGAGVEDDSLDKEASTAKNYSRRVTYFDSSEKNDKVKGGILAPTYSGIDWMNKISPFFPYVNTYKSRDHVSPGIKLASLNSAEFSEQADKMWIDPFDKLPDATLQKLQSAKMIFSPSLPNVQLLSEKCPATIVAHTLKPLPYVEPKVVPLFEDKKYVVALNRNGESTKFLIDNWNKDLPPLAIVGLRGGKFPDYVLPVNEYLGYDKLLFILLNASCFIDLPVYNDYISAFLHLMLAVGIPITSSNWFVMDKPGCEFMLTEKKEKVRLPTVAGLHNSVTKSIEKSSLKRDLSNYNENLMNFMSLLVS